MKFLVGICGIGKGHCTRQYEICKELTSRGHEVRILTFGEGVDFFKKTEITSYEVFVPFITFKGKNINVVDCIKKNARTFLPGKLKNKRVISRLKKDLFIPDICISDYEPVVASIAYKYKIPLINIDQQSKFMYMQEDNVNSFYNTEERKRLQFFFPKYKHKFIVSFYDIPNIKLPANVELVYPIIRNDLVLELANRKKAISSNIVVYFSKYIDQSIQQSLEEVVSIFNKFPKYNFRIFSSEKKTSDINIGTNVQILENSRESFVKELVSADGVISTAGHTLIAESFYCNIPVFVIPLPTFDQHYCGKFISDNKLGITSYTITEENLSNFLSNIDVYKSNIINCENLISKTDSLKYIADKLETMASCNFSQK